MKLISKFATTLLLLALMLSVIPAAAVQPAMAATCNWALLFQMAQVMHQAQPLRRHGGSRTLGHVHGVMSL